MDLFKLLKLAESFLSLAGKTKEELPKDSDDQNLILSNIEKLESYAARIKYAEKNLKHLSSGSSRVVYQLQDGSILKLAKNDRGLAQNKVEGNSEMNSLYLNKLIKKAKNHAWINVPFLNKITEKEFENLTGLNFKEFGKAISYGLKEVSGVEEVEPKNFKNISNSKIYKELDKLGKKFKLMPGDMARISSYGEKDGRPILIDAGLTKEIFDKYY